MKSFTRCCPKASKILPDPYFEYHWTQIEIEVGLKGYKGFVVSQKGDFPIFVWSNFGRGFNKADLVDAGIPSHGKMFGIGNAVQ